MYPPLHWCIPSLRDNWHLTFLVQSAQRGFWVPLLAAHSLLLRSFDRVVTILYVCGITVTLYVESNPWRMAMIDPLSCR